MRKWFSFVLLCVCFQTQAQVNMPATQAFLKRMVGTNTSRFEIRQIPVTAGKDVFELDHSGKKIVLRGSNGVSIASALNLYLRQYCHVLSTWNDPYPVLPVIC